MKFCWKKAVTSSQTPLLNNFISWANSICPTNVYYTSSKHLSKGFCVTTFTRHIVVGQSCKQQKVILPNKVISSAMGFLFILFYFWQCYSPSILTWVFKVKIVAMMNKHWTMKTFSQDVYNLLFGRNVVNQKISFLNLVPNKLIICIKMFYSSVKIEFGLRASVERLSQCKKGGEGMTTCKSLNMDLIQQASTTQ